MSELAFGAILRHLRHAAGLSLRSVAREIGVSPAYLSQVETGKEHIPAPPRLTQLEAVLGLDRGELLGLTDRVDPRVLGLLRAQPGATQLLLAAAEAGFDDRDFRGLAAEVRAQADGPAPWWRRADVIADEADAPMRGLRAVLTPERCAVGLDPADRAALFDMLVERLATQDPALDAPVVVSLLHERELEASTGLGAGIALPHAWVPLYAETTLTIATLQRGVAFNRENGDLVTLVFLLLSPAPPTRDHVRLLARIARLCHDRTACDALRAATDPTALFGRVCTFDRQLT